MQEAVQVGTLNPSNSEEVKAFRITVPTPEVPTVIEGEINTSTCQQKRLESLAKARACKKNTLASTSA